LGLWLIEPISDRLATGSCIYLIALALAGWFGRMRGQDDHGVPIDIRHSFADTLRRAASEDPWPMLSIAPLFGDLAKNADLGRDRSRFPRICGPIALELFVFRACFSDG
jgi:mannitol-1-phosphate/altronate dehydrogenase